MSDIEEDYFDNSDTSSESEHSINNEKPLFKIKENIKIVDQDDADPDDTNPEMQINLDDDNEDNDSINLNEDKDYDSELDEDDLNSDLDDDSDDDSDEENIENKNKIFQEKQIISGGVKKTKKNQIIIDDDEVDDIDDNYLQKFDNEITKNYIVDFHPECLHNNYDEIEKLSHVIRNSSNIIIDPFHKTLPFLTKYEKTRILGQRAKQIETGSKPLIRVPENIIDSYIIAELELKEKKIPFIIRRPIPGGAFEYWKLKDLEIISF